MKTNREELGKAVRKIWIEWAKQQPVIKESWLYTWENLSEPDKEVDRQIGEHIYNLAIDDAEEVPQEMRGEGENDLRCVASRIRGLKVKA
jgi:hypothetical protein